jgi:hypothetical protein
VEGDQQEIYGMPNRTNSLTSALYRGGFNDCIQLLIFKLELMKDVDKETMRKVLNVVKLTKAPEHVR